MNNDEKRRFLIKELSSLKSEGLRVFANVPNEHNCSHYGLITDGTSIVMVQFGEYGSSMFVTSYEWIPSRKNGSGCRVNDIGCAYEYLTRDVFEEAVRYGRNYAARCGAELYRNVEHYFTCDSWRKAHYKEL